MIFPCVKNISTFFRTETIFVPPLFTPINLAVSSNKFLSTKVASHDVDFTLTERLAFIRTKQPLPPMPKVLTTQLTGRFMLGTLVITGILANTITTYPFALTFARTKMMILIHLRRHTVGGLATIVTSYFFATPVIAVQGCI